MRLFLVFFFVVYSMMHLYAYLKIKTALSLGLKHSIPLILFMAIMIVAPLIVHYAENSGFEQFARFMSYTGYTWLGILFLFISLSILIDTVRIMSLIIGLIVRKDILALLPSAKLTFFISLSLIAASCIYGYFEAREIRVEHLMVKTSKIPIELNNFRIVQISDVHLGLIVRKDRLRRITEAVKEARPDLLVSTGDLVDGQINRLEGLAEMLRDIKPEYGKYAITGNHEFYAGLTQAMEFTKRAGFTVLRGSVADVKGIINIAGVDDEAGKIYKLFTDIHEKDLLSGRDNKKFTLLLKHRPLIDESAIGMFDLQLSGHTHKGQIFPFSLLTKLYYPLDTGYMDLSGNSRLYVSRGSGTWGPPIRLLSPPEVTVIDLIHDINH